MLKVAKITLVAATLGLALAQPAFADVNKSLTNICKNVVADDKGQLRKKIRNAEVDFRVKLGDVYEGVTCNGQSLIRTAIEQNAVKVGTLLVKRMPASALKAAESDGKTLQAWIEENGYSNNPIAVKLDERI